MPEKNTERQESRESQQEGLSLHPFAQSPDAAPARQLKRPGDSGPTLPAEGMRKMTPPPLQLAERTPGGLPMDLKMGLEDLSGYSMDDVRVHYNSSEPAKVQALAYARGTDIFLAPGQEAHLPHEAWHVVQQKQGRVSATTEINKEGVNDDERLEQEADEMGAKAAKIKSGSTSPTASTAAGTTNAVVQRMPADFVDHAVLQEAAKIGIGRTSLWAPLRTAVTAYSQVDPGQRKNRLKLLREMAVFGDRWKIARGLPTKAITDLDEAERRKLLALTDLETDIINEYTELGASNGDLEVDDPELGNVSPEPELTTARSESDGRKRGFFLAGAGVVNAQGVNIANPAEGVVCRITKTETKPGGANANLYYAVRPAPGSDRDFGTVAPFTAGFVLKTHVNALNLDKSATKTLQYEDRFDPDLHPLFQAPPSVEDVQQSQLGDCYLLAAVLSVIRHTPDHFTDHMVDHGNGVVSVQLYEKNGDAFAPKVVHVRKSVVVKKAAQTSLEEGYNKGAIWVQLLEKAYIAAGFSGDKLETLPGTKRQWSQAASGTASIAFGHLTGRTATVTGIHSVDPREYQEDSNWAGIGGHTLFAHLWGLDPVGHARGMQFMDVREALAARIAALKDTKDEIRLSDVEPVIRATPGMPVPLADEIVNWLATQNIYPGGKRGKARYSTAQLDAFQAVVTAVNAGQMITASSKDHMKRGNNNRDGQSGGENVHNGLAGPHGYEVIDFSMQPSVDDVNVPAANTICWVKLRNPWGNTGRVYKNTNTDTDMTQNDFAPVVDKMEDRATENPEFWVPLEDFTKRFSSITTL